MVSKALILVLVIGEAALRSTLVARLSMAGADIITAERVDSSRLERALRGNPILVVDDAAVSEHPAGLAGILADSRWHAVALVSGEAPGEKPDSDSRLLRLARSSSGADLEARLASWRTELD